MSLRSQRMKLPANVGQKKTKALEQTLNEFKVGKESDFTLQIDFTTQNCQLLGHLVFLYKKSNLTKKKKFVKIPSVTDVDSSVKLFYCLFDIESSLQFDFFLITQTQHRHQQMKCAMYSMSSVPIWFYCVNYEQLSLTASLNWKV